MSRGTVLFTNGCRALAAYKDERSAATFAALLAKLPPLSEHDDLSQKVVGPLAGCALDLGSLDDVGAAVKLFKVFAGPKQEPVARALHDALSEYAKRLGAAPPEWSERVAAAWQEWFEANKAKLPKKLGRLAAPPKDPSMRPQDGLPGKSG